jgi:fatty acid desaturase
LALMVVRLLGSDSFDQISAGGQLRMDQARALLENLRVPLAAASLLYLTGWMLMCLAAPLIYWQKMALGKALFFSVVTVAREFKAYITAAVLLYLLLQVIGLLPLLLVGLLGLPSLGVAVLFSITLLIVLLVHCTLYASYRQLFGAPDASADVKLDPP